ncbi:MAG: ThiF family adenylyltransferase [Candidatus Pristimantibacillus lignocellulolyticus]|uniref:ThiF family adenylyltransferase n=1 Tax=Candidatus Pristimantibacillus lignocellulolyticus TaxID=2994561 RepID=A0A9J6ZFM9_9BACL|nr:MAG: ThiF family adenylyltransferase [Candidatus Pristimantibacillus lignocellulolyticus]
MTDQVIIDNLSRYSKQLKISHIGATGQTELHKARCAIVGLGALGSVIAEQLARAGIGYLRLIDRDFVEFSNLQRQIMYTEEDAIQFSPKATAAARHLQAINSNIEIVPVIADLSAINIGEYLDQIDIIIDGSDNFSVRYLINEYSIAHEIPWVYGAVVGTSGSTATFIPKKTPCYRCLFPEKPALGTVETCDTAGVLSPIVHMIASIQVTEVIKFCSHNSSFLHQSLLQLDCWTNDQLKLNIAHARKTDCPVCVQQHFENLLHDEPNVFSSTLCGRNAVQVTLPASTNITLDQLEVYYNTHYKLKRNTYLLKLFYDEKHTIIFFPDGRAIVQGTDDIARAEAIIAHIVQI